jgi:hypothetical protein
MYCGCLDRLDYLKTRKAKDVGTVLSKHFSGFDVGYGIDSLGNESVRIGAECFSVSGMTPNEIVAAASEQNPGEGIYGPLRKLSADEMDARIEVAPKRKPSGSDDFLKEIP